MMGKYVSCRISAEQWRVLKLIADQRHCSVAAVVRSAIAEYCKQERRGKE